MSTTLNPIFFKSWTNQLKGKFANAKESINPLRACVALAQADSHSCRAEKF
jgi:hypothetical protein